MVCRRPSLAPGTRSFLKMNTGLIRSVRVFPRQHRGFASMSLEDWAQRSCLAGTPLRDQCWCRSATRLLGSSPDRSQGASDVRASAHVEPQWGKHVRVPRVARPRWWRELRGYLWCTWPCSALPRCVLGERPAGLVDRGAALRKGPPKRCIWAAHRPHSGCGREGRVSGATPFWLP